jgi:hypothetical protein
MAQEQLAFSAHPGHGDSLRIVAEAAQQVKNNTTGIATDKTNDSGTEAFNRRPANQAPNR